MNSKDKLIVMYSLSVSTDHGNDDITPAAAVVASMFPVAYFRPQTKVNNIRVSIDVIPPKRGSTLRIQSPILSAR